MAAAWKLPPRLSAKMPARPLSGMRRHASTPVSSRVQATSSTGASKNVMGFFTSMERGLGEEFRDLVDEEQALQAGRRSERRYTKDDKFGKRCPENPKDDESRGRGASKRAGHRNGSSASLPPTKSHPARDVSAGAQLYLDAWRKHEQAWNDFQEKPPCPLSVDLVPWPPCSHDVIEFCEKLNAPGQRRQAYRIACRRWHPDKFLQHFGSLAQSADLPSLTARLNDVFQAVVSDWERSRSK